MGTHDLQRRLGRMNGQWPIAHLANGIDDKWQTSRMIKVRMCNEHMIDLCQFCDRQVAHAGACINQDIVIDQ
jgi:hypothetical protein